MSKEQELRDKIEKTKKNAAIPEKIKTSMIAAFEKQLEKITPVTPTKGPAKPAGKKDKTDIDSVIEKGLAQERKLGKKWDKMASKTRVSVLRGSSSEFENEDIEDYKGANMTEIAANYDREIRLAILNAVLEYESKHTKKSIAPPKIKTKSTYKFKGKNLEELSEEECAEAIKESKERREKAAKAEKKSKRRPVMEKVTANVAKAVKKVIENIPAADLKDAPKTELKKIDRVVTAAKNFVKELKTILGDDFDKDTIDDEFKEIHALAKELHKKYGE